MPTPSIVATPTDEAWYHQSIEVVFAEFHSSASGLAPSEAEKRLAKDGPNELNEIQRITPLQIILRQFKSLIIWILIVAGVGSAVLGQVMDAIAILAIVVLNAAIGFYQEFNAGKSIAALKKMAAPQAKVRRGSSVVSIPATRVVTGDILVLEAGDRIAADARLMTVASLKCIESALTGESEAVGKQAEPLGTIDLPLGDRTNMVFMGTSVAAGTGQAVVVATAMATELGRIAGLISVASEEEQTPLQRKLDSFGHILIWGALGIVSLLFGLGWLRGVKPLELLMTSVGLAVAAVPEGLPAIVTVALSVGVMRMARRRALVRKLAAVETLGSTSIICTDKTGTLTVGEMTVRMLFVADQNYEVTGEGYGPVGEVRRDGQKVQPPHLEPLHHLASVLLGCNQAHLVETNGAWTTVGDPTEGAMRVAAIKVGGNRPHLEQELPRVQEFPFDSERKRSAVVRRMPNGKLRAFINGAPGPLLERCAYLYTREGVRPLTAADRAHLSEQIASMAQKALRVLGSSWRDLEPITPSELTAETVERDLVFVGLTGMHDPPRPEAKAAIAKCHAAGIRVVMITGDHPATAEAIAREIGLPLAEDAVMEGIELERLSEDELRQKVDHIAVYARVTAAHKLRIIHALKAGGAVVAMTGDGVNDAPALKGADIGIAMGKAGTEVAKQAADMIITDDNFATLVTAIEEGRGIYANIRKTLQYLLAGNTSELLLMTVCVIIGLPSPLLPIHLLWINLLTDGLPALCLAADPIDSDLMKRHPRPRTERITNARFVGTMILTGVLTARVAFAVYDYVLRQGSVESARTAAFAVLVYAELLRSFGARSETKPVWRISLLTNINLVVVVVASFGLQVLSQQNAVFGQFLRTTTIPLADSFLLLALGSIPLVVLEGVENRPPPMEGANERAGMRGFE
jgi:Ca2+-transporting ATPase